MHLLRVLVFCTLTVTVLSQVPSLNFYCLDDSLVSGRWRMEMLLRTSTPLTPGDVHGVIIATNGSTFTTCSNDLPWAFDPVVEIPGDGSDADPYTLVVAINSGTGFLVSGFPGCGYENAVGTVYEWGIQIHTVPEFPEQNRLVCDYSNPATTETKTVSSAVDMTERPGATVIELMPAVKLSVVDGSSNQPLTAINTIDPKLKVEFRTGPQFFSDVEDATGVYPYDCFLCDTEDCMSGTLAEQLTDTNGCPVGNVLSSGFSGDGVTMFSSPMNLLFLTTSNIPFVYIRCSFEYCTTATTNAVCMDSCSNLPGRKRKRRDVEHVLSIKHSLRSEQLDTHSEDRRRKRSSYSQPREQVRSKCQTSKGFVITMVTLASILAVAMVISIVQCVRLFSLLKE